MPSFAQGEREILEDDDIRLLKNHFLKRAFTKHEHDVVSRYLLSCYTGLRKSDIEAFDTRIHLKKNTIRLDMFKTRKYGKSVEFTVPEFVLELIDGRRGRLFQPMESALLNKTLRRCLNNLGISTYIKFHSGRDWFATQYLKLGGNLKDLQEILGHASIKTTEIYLKMSRRGKGDIITRFNKLDTPGTNLSIKLQPEILRELKLIQLKLEAEAENINLEDLTLRFLKEGMESFGIKIAG